MITFKFQSGATALIALSFIPVVVTIFKFQSGATAFKNDADLADALMPLNSNLVRLHLLWLTKSSILLKTLNSNLVRLHYRYGHPLHCSRASFKFQSGATALIFLRRIPPIFTCFKFQSGATAFFNATFFKCSLKCL